MQLDTNNLMQIIVHDYAGHPFQVELSRELARRGHSVKHAYFASDTGPKGHMKPEKDDTKRLSFLPLGEDIEYSKTDFRRRRQGDIAYGRALAKFVSKIKPDVIISGNTPTESQEAVVALCKRENVPFIYWCQDFYSIAASRLLEKKLPVFGHAIGAYYQFLERRQMHRSSKVVHITDAFCEQTDKWGIPAERISVIPNWGAIDEINVLPRDTNWAEENQINAQTRFLYSGTLALKHNPMLLARLANSLDEGQEVVLVSAGVGADFLRDKVTNNEVRNLRILPLQSFDIFDQVLASGDVLLAVIEREAGTFSVPSKILSYLCAGRPIVLAAPKENLAAQILRETGAGLVVEPEDVDGFRNAALQYANYPDRANAAGKAGRRYAEENFDLSKVASRFEMLFEQLVAKK